MKHLHLIFILEVKKKKNTGPSIEPWETPHDIGAKVISELLYDINCLDILDNFNTSVIFSLLQSNFLILLIKIL